MSTFRGIVAEFPEIRIDYFCTIPETTPPLACFLSHVHSDHLRGLESLKSPFVYCSLVTKQMLLRLEKYPHRMNFARGILESRKVTYRHLRKILKPIPLETPTDIELRPGYQIRVTLFDANHCPGAVMFLVEGNGKAVLYTGDIRSESWWVNALSRNPVIIPYTCGIKVLDKLYLDTTYALGWKSRHTFPSKADGLRELLGKIAHYPARTVFHFNAWTYGYEDVWLCLSSALNSKIHVDQYKWRIYKSLTETAQLRQEQAERRTLTTGYGPALCGYTFGNSFQPGCLTSDENVRIHSCERGTACSGITANNVVHITPIITRTGDNEVISEPGAGGGDLRQIHDLELGNASMMDQLLQLCLRHLADPQLVQDISSMIQRTLSCGNSTVSLNGLGLDSEDVDVPLHEVARLLASRVSRDSGRDQQGSLATNMPDMHQPSHYGRGRKDLPRALTFPYSRHSSYSELCHLVEMLRPKDVYPCVVDREDSDPDRSIEALFGPFCCGTQFAYDEEVKERIRVTRSEDGLTQSSSLCTPEPEMSQTAESVGTLSVPQQSNHVQRREAPHEQSSPSLVERASDANGQIVLEAPNRLLRKGHRPSPHVPFSLGVKSQVNRVNMIKEAFRRWPPASTEKAKGRSRAPPPTTPDLEPSLTEETSSVTRADSDAPAGNRHLVRPSEPVRVLGSRSSLISRVSKHGPSSAASVGSMPNQPRRRSNVSRVTAQAASTASPKGDGSASLRKSQRGSTEQPHSDPAETQRDGGCRSTAITPTSDDEDDEMLEALFDSQSTTVGNEGVAARVRRRVEAYEAALGRSEMAWSIHSPLTAGNNHTAEEVIL